MFMYKKRDNVLYEFADDIAPRYITASLPIDYSTIACGDKFGNFFIGRLPQEISTRVCGLFGLNAPIALREGIPVPNLEDMSEIQSNHSGPYSIKQKCEREITSPLFSFLHPLLSRIVIAYSKALYNEADHIQPL